MDFLVYAGLIFFAVFLLSQALIVPAFGESRQARKRLRKRLDEIEQSSQQDGIASLLREKYLRNLSPWERQLEALPAMEALGRQIEQAGHGTLAYRLVVIAIALGVGAAVFAWVSTRIAWVAGVAFFMGAALPFIRIARARAQRFAKFEEQLPDAIDVMRRGMMAGHPFNATLKLVADDMDNPVKREFELTFADINYGNDVRRAMLGLLSRVPSVTVMALVTSVLVQKETGGNLAEILEQISKVVRARFRFQRRVRTLSAEGRMSAWVLAAVPLILFGAMMVINPDYMPMLFDDPFGQRILAGAVVWAVIGIFFLRKIIQIEV
jgi:tight adherence protein B